MKISKLFHWLYAFLMLLPIAFLVPNIFYYAFNDNATNSHIETATINYKYETNEVNSVEDLIEGNIYHIEIEDTTIDNFLNMNEDMEFHILCYNFTFNLNDNYLDPQEYEYVLWPNLSNPINNLVLGVGVFSYQTSIEVYIDNAADYFYDFNIPTLDNWEFTFIGECVFLDFADINDIDDTSFISVSQNIPIESVEITTSDLDIVDSIENNLRKTWDLSLFSWTHNNIIIQPFSYLCGLFGMSNNSIIAYYLDYWVCISVIYLVFDLVMYVPLLAHKWIDKAKVE